MTRDNDLYETAKSIEKLLRQYGKDRALCQRVYIIYERLSRERVRGFSPFQREYFHLLSGEEYFLIYDDWGLMYAVNVTGDSVLTAGNELLSLVAKKF